MKISHINIENFRGIELFELSDCSKLNVIAGINGAGKSSILVAIKILLSWLIARIRNAKGNGIAINDSDITKGKDFCLLKITMNDGLTWQLYKQRSTARFKPKYKTDLVKMSSYADSIAEQLGKDENTDLPLIDAYGVNRAVKETPMRVRAAHKLKPLDALSVDMSNSVNFHEFFIWFREMEDIENENMRNTGVLVKHKSLEAIRNIIPLLFLGYSDFKVRRSPKKAFIISKDGVEFDFNQLSDGEKTTMALFFDIARRMAMTHSSLDNPLEGEGIVIIDELELHLHPDWQADMITKLRQVFPNCQFFITSTSYQIIDSALETDGTKYINIKKERIK